MLGRRIDSIGETAQRVLTTGACIGRMFGFDFLTALGADKEGDLLDALEEAEQARLLVAHQGRKPSFVFAHWVVATRCPVRGQNSKWSRLG